MLPSEKATDFVRRVLVDVLQDLEPTSLERNISRYFHPKYTQSIDQQHLNRDAFVSLTRAQKARLAEPPVFTFDRLVATEPQGGRIHVTSVHSVAIKLKNGDNLLQRVFALIDVDCETGMLISCDESTHMEGVPATVPPADAVLMVANLIRAASGQRAVSVRGIDDRPAAFLPNAKQPRSNSADSPGHLNNEVQMASTTASTVKLGGLELRRSGVSDLLASSKLMGEWEHSSGLLHAADLAAADLSDSESLVAS